MHSRELVTDAQIAALTVAAAGTAPFGITYGTVRDYCELADLAPRLASHNGDLKDQQRGWMLKALLGLVPPGATLVEIGAGEPIVADVLGRAGYRVIVVDPYEGAGNGPTELEAFRAAYPHVEFVVDLFREGLPDIAPGSVACCYSVSVLEHIPPDQLRAVAAATRRYLAPGGLVAHAIDHVLAGAGAEYHREMLEVVAVSLGLSRSDLAAALERAERDTDTYFLSAEGHNRWRGATPYDQFPMRRCISVQMVTDGLAGPAPAGT